MNKKLYHPDWTDIIRPAILARDKYRCQHCFVSHKHYYLLDEKRRKVQIEVDEYNEYLSQKRPVIKIYLQVAHKDNDKMNNSFDNLISLCPGCHLIMDRSWKRILRLTNKGQGKELR